MGRKHIAQIFLACSITLQRCCLFLHQFIQLHRPARRRSGQSILLQLVDAQQLLLRQLVHHLCQVCSSIHSGHTVAIIMRQHFLHQIIVAFIRGHTALEHQGMQRRAEERVQRGILQRCAPHLLSLGILANRLQRTRAETLAVRTRHLLIIRKHRLHKVVRCRRLVAENHIVHAAVRAAETAHPLTALRAHRVGAVTGLAAGVGRNTMRHGCHCPQVGHGTAHAAVAQRGLCPAFIGIRQVIGTALHRVTELGCTGIRGSPAGNAILIPRQVNSLGSKLIRSIIPVLPGVGHHKA